MKQLVCEVDLTKIEGNGDFSCPKCGITISPEDETERVYSILEIKVKSQILEELVIQCNKCATQIHLTGFPLLQKLSEIDEEKLENEKKRRKPMLHYSSIILS